MLLCIAASVYAQTDIGQQVVIVTTNDTENTKEISRNIVDWLDDQGYEKDARAYEKYVPTGSGAVVEAPGGDYLVLTNAHVMSQSNTANIEIPAYDGNSAIKFEDLPLVYRSTAMDISLLLLPEEAKDVFTPLTISTDYSAGDEVWAAGYPMLLGESSWQITKGDITSTRANAVGFDVVLSGGVLQHTAEIASGSSGGPLLKKNDSGYEVVGINTWSVSRRDDSKIFFSIPAPDLNAALASYSSLEGLSSAEKERMLQEKLALMESVFVYDESGDTPTGDEKKNLVQCKDLFTVEYVLENGWIRFLDYIESLNSGDFNFTVSSFFNGESFEVLHRATMYEVFTLLSKKNPGVELDTPEIDGDTAVVMITINGKDIESTWEFTQGDWRLSAFPIQKSRGLTSGTSNRYWGLGAGMRILKDEFNVLDKTTLFSVNYVQGFQYKYFTGSYLASVAFGSPLEADAFGYTYGPLIILDISYRLGGRLPFLLNDRKFLISPNASAGIGLGMGLWSNDFESEFDLAFSVPLNAGVEFGFSKDGVGFPFRMALEVEYPIYIKSDASLLKETAGPTGGISFRFSK